MNKQWLLMKYHPAKKEVEFHRYHNDKEVSIRSDSKLMLYVNKKGKFVLQDHGNEFFNDIASAFDGLKEVEIKAIMTKLDFEDFEQMVEYYNEEAAKCKISTTLLSELPDMAHTFNEVKKYGEAAIEILESHKHKFFEIPLENDDVKRSAENFSSQLSDEINNIREKIDRLADNNVSLCFTGVYTAGKSALINALIGYRILPENVTSETAKMFRLFSPKNGEPVKISFQIMGVASELEWDDGSCAFEFVKGPSESVIRTEIQEELNGLKESHEALHNQIRTILSRINKMGEVSPEITILFPIPLDTSAVQFTIYDTPGTDSNYLEHQAVLNEALEEQTQSILIFVVHPGKLEGEGNNALLNYLKAAEEKNSKTSIDIGRSLFVVNHADGLNAEDRETLRFGEIKHKEDSSFSIKLADKKLFFTSARYGYAAKAVHNGVETKDESWYFKKSEDLTDEASPIGPCYIQNHCATSERATAIMKEKCDVALRQARESKDDYQILQICSGLYALEKEIVTYGEKYAAAVKAYAIIDSVDKALKKLSNRAYSLKESNRREIASIEAEIKELKVSIDAAIEKAYSQTAVHGNELPVEVQKKLGVDEKSILNNLVNPTISKVDKRLKGWFFGHGAVRTNRSHKENVRGDIQSGIDSFTRDFKKARKDLLEEQRDSFMRAVIEAITKNGDISEEAKQWILNIPAPSIPNPDRFNDVDQIYDAHKRAGKIIASVEHLDKEGFVNAVEDRLKDTAELMCRQFRDDYRKALDTTLEKIKAQYKANLDSYSIAMKALLNNKEAMQRLGEKVEDAAAALAKCQNELNGIIWEEVRNA